jgi:hypothetical protein
MHRIDLKAVLLAFAAEFALDMLVVRILVMIFGSELFVPGMSEDEVQKVIEAIAANGNYQLTAFACGMATTILGGYLAARLAKGFPYYNGLAIGVVGVVFVLILLIFSSGGPRWVTIIGTLLTIPAAIYGAHLASKRTPTEE